MARSSEKIRAKELRLEGKSIKAIAKQLNVSVSSVSSWCREIQLSNEQLLQLQSNARNPFYGKRAEYIARKKEERNLKVEMLLREGISDIGDLTNRELFLVGVSLYWSEGFKKDSQVGFANSNPRMIQLFIRWLELCGYSRKDLLVRVTTNAAHKKRIKEVESYWADVTGVPLNEFRKPFFQQVKWKKVYESPNEYYGVLRIKVRKSTDFLRKIHGWIEGLSLQA